MRVRAAARVVACPAPHISRESPNVLRLSGAEGVRCSRGLGAIRVRRLLPNEVNGLEKFEEGVSDVTWRVLNILEISQEPRLKGGSLLDQRHKGHVLVDGRADLITSPHRFTVVCHEQDDQVERFRQTRQDLVGHLTRLIGGAGSHINVEK